MAQEYCRLQAICKYLERKPSRRHGQNTHTQSMRKHTAQKTKRNQKSTIQHPPDGSIVAYCGRMDDSKAQTRPYRGGRRAQIPNTGRGRRGGGQPRFIRQFGWFPSQTGNETTTAATAAVIVVTGRIQALQSSLQRTETVSRHVPNEYTRSPRRSQLPTIGKSQTGRDGRSGCRRGCRTRVMTQQQQRYMRLCHAKDGHPIRPGHGSQ